MCCNTLSRKLMLSVAAFGVVLGVGRFASTYALADKPETTEKAKDDQTVKVPAVLDFDETSITGQDIHLSQYYGQVLLIVNTASKCGNTPQYEQLQALHEDHHEQGLAILGFPANDFGKQEPGSDEDIQAFCKKNYGVEFQMFSKVAVKGEDISPLYAYLTSKESNPEFGGPIQWNFDKFLVSRNGKVIARFKHKTKPDAKEVVDAIQAALKQPVPDDVEQVRALHAPKQDKSEKDDKSEKSGKKDKE